MKNKIQIKIIPKVKIHRFNQVSINFIDTNPPVKIEKKRYSFSKTTSSY